MCFTYKYSSAKNAFKCFSDVNACRSRVQNTAGCGWIIKGVRGVMWSCLAVELAEPNQILWLTEKRSQNSHRQSAERTTPPFWASLKEGRVLRARMHQKQRFDIWASNTRRCCNDSRSPLWISLLLFFLSVESFPVAIINIWFFLYAKTPHTCAEPRARAHSSIHKQHVEHAVNDVRVSESTPPPSPKPHFYRDDESAPQSFSLTHLFFS